MTGQKPLRVAFRVDAALWIGAGHVMRCATLAKFLRQNNTEVHFICRELPGNYSAWLEQSGFDVHRLSTTASPHPEQNNGSEYTAWLGVDLGREIFESGTVLDQHGPFDWLVVDHYAIDREWESALARNNQKIMVIDDLANRRHDCSLLLDQNLQPEPARYQTLVAATTKQLIGPRYALLRPQFGKLRSPERHRIGQMKRLLIAMGGSDPDNWTGRILLALTQANPDPGLGIDVVIGSEMPMRQQVAEHCARLPNCHLYVQTPEMARLMRAADVMIGTPGTTTWERCCLGLPAILLSVAANQRQNGRLTAKQKAAIYLGDASATSIGALPGLLAQLAHHPALLSRMSSRAFACVDGKGTRRAGITLLADNIELRLATAADCRKVWQWRNDPGTRQTSFDPAAIPYVQHQQWYQRVITDSDRVLLIGKAGNEDIGVLRYDRSDEAWEISVYLDPDLHGLGLGSRLIAAGSRWLTQNQPPPHRIVARILKDNQASSAAFRKAEFRPSGDAFLWQTEAATPTKESSC